MKLYTLLLTVFLLGTITINAQAKDEHEVRIDLHEFPKKAITVIEAMPQLKKLKLYKETDSVKISYEAKFKYKKNHYSLEFNTNGDIEDIELLIKKKQLTSKLNNALKAFFKNNYKSYNYIKIQKQYIPGASNLKGILDIINNTTSLKANYEIIAEVRNKTKREVREFLFSPEGELINSRPLKPSSYEHIMY